MPQPVKNLRTITSDGFVTTGGAPEETLPLRLDGAAAAASIAVGVGTTLIISDIVATATAATNYRLQQTNDGITFFDLVLLRAAASGTVILTELRSPVQVNGGTTVAIRMRVETPGGAADVSATIRSYAEAAV